MAFNHYGYNSLKNDQTNKRLRTDYDRDSRTNSSVSYEDGRRKNPETQPNHILLLTITKVTYPINTDVIHTISKDHGNVLRIVIFRKRGVQAMVEYEDVDQAVRAKQLMDGADIYQGCCTLRVEYAKPSKLNVYKNDSETWDYTTPNPGEKKKLLPYYQILQELHSYLLVQHSLDLISNVGVDYYLHHTIYPTIIMVKVIQQHRDVVY